ncbi:MAG: hypothetical protein ACJ736_31650 [Streptomyces sp.]
MVVGIDGSESSLEAVDLAAAEAAWHSLSLHFVHTAAGVHEGDHEHSDVTSAGRDVFALVLGSGGLGDPAYMLLGAVRNSRFGTIVVGVEEGEGGRTALRCACREVQMPQVLDVGLRGMTQRCRDARASPQAPGAPSVAGHGVG